MADFIRVLVSGYDTQDPKKDKITNTIYLRQNNPVWGADVDSPDWQNLAGDLVGVWGEGMGHYLQGVDRLEIKLYDMEDDAPRMPKATHTETVVKYAAGVREVALCLSFRGESNVPRQRGRIFLGPFKASELSDRPSATLRGHVGALAGRIAGLGGLDIDWCVYSPTQNVGSSLGDSFKPVRASWVDDAWDTQRSRGLPPTLRLNNTHNG